MSLQLWQKSEVAAALETTERDKAENQEATAGLAATKKTGTDAAPPGIFAELDGH